MKRLLRQAFTLEFNRAVLRQVEIDGKQAVDAARELGVTDQTLHTLLKPFREVKLTGATADDSRADGDVADPGRERPDKDGRRDRDGVL